MQVIRDLPTGPNCPIIATTAYYTTDSSSEIEMRGFDGCLLKPIDAVTLVDYLQKIVTKFHN
jgi:CheY-like chemotaxis protein